MEEAETEVLSFSEPEWKIFYDAVVGDDMIENSRIREHLEKVMTYRVGRGDALLNETAERARKAIRSIKDAMLTCSAEERFRLRAAVDMLDAMQSKARPFTDLNLAVKITHNTLDDHRRDSTDRHGHKPLEQADRDTRDTLMVFMAKQTTTTPTPPPLSKRAHSGP
jgi:hypothetical protein